MFASTVNGFGDQMNGLDFFFHAPATVNSTAAENPTTSSAVTAENNEEDDDWGEFVDSSAVVSRTEPLTSDPIGWSPDRNGTDSLELPQPDSASEKKSQAQWVKPRGPVPLSVFGEAEEEESERDGSGASVPSLTFSFDSLSGKHNNGDRSVNKVVNMNPSVGINVLIANLYRQNGENKPKNGLNSELDGNLSNLVTAGAHVEADSTNFEQNDTDSSQNVLNSVASVEHLNLDTKSFEPKSNTMHSSTSGMMLDPNVSSFVGQNDDIDEDDGWEFKIAESKLHTGDGDPKSDEKQAENGTVAVSNPSNSSWNFWSLATNNIGPEVNKVKTDADISVLGNENDDSWITDGWEFKVAEPGEQKNDITCKVEGNDKKDVKGAGLAFAFQNGVHQNGDLFVASLQQSSGWGFEMDLSPMTTTETISISHSNSQSENNDLSFFQSDENMRSEETSGGFKQSSSETEENAVMTDIPPAVSQTHPPDGAVQKNEPQFEKPKGPLSLSIFGDGDIEVSDPVVHEDISTSIQAPTSRDKTKTPGPSISINDLISSLYIQVEEKTSTNLTKNSDENGFGSAKTVPDSKSVDGGDDFEDYSWEFQGPTNGTIDSGVQEDGDFDDDSWEFQGPTQPVTFSDSMKEDNSYYKFEDGSLGSEDEGQNSAPAVNGVELNDYKDFYDKLKTELCYIALNHLEDLKKARNLAADSGEGSVVEKYDEEIGNLHKMLHEDIGEVNLESSESKPTGTGELVEALREPKFQAMASEYYISERLLLAEKDWKSTMELLKHAMLILKILTMGTPDQQSNYTSAWADIASVCARELRHGESIWKQAMETNAHQAVLSKPRGKNYILALGEVYRVAKILGASATLYKPWIMATPTTNLPALLSDCDSSWSCSGLKEALLNITNPSELHHDEAAASLLESIKYISELDTFTLHSRIFAAREPTCNISGLTAEIIPGMKTVEWNGETYFLTLANLWANLINPEPPCLPRILSG